MPALSEEDTRLDKTLRIIEVYASIQGESTWAGLPCAFVRLARCNLRCRWCDTTYSFHGGEPLRIGALLERVRQFGLPLVEITGGEPLAQPHCGDLAALLLETGHTVLVETSGSLPIDRLPAAAIKIMDLKCPGSGESEKNHWPNIALLNPAQDEVKFVIADRRDYEWSRDILERYTLQDRCKAVLFSPVFGEIAPLRLAEWILADRLPVRFQLQLHKILWPPDARGV
jgi:7-carboxy-7-deazaguanine synthase